MLLAVLAVSVPAQAVSPGSVDAAIMALAAATMALDDVIPKARLESLQKALLKAIENTTLGAAECATGTEVKADNRYRYTRGWLLNYKKTLGSVGLGASALAAQADAIIAMIDALIAIKCAGDDPPVSTAVFGVGGQPR